MIHAEWIVVSAIGLVWLLIMGYSVRSLTIAKLGAFLVCKRLWCHTMARDAEVEFVMEDGVPSAILRCSLAGDFGVIECRKTCIAQSFGDPLALMLHFGSIRQDAENLNELDTPPVSDTQEGTPKTDYSTSVSPPSPILH